MLSPTRLITYDAWANREALDSLRRMADPPPQAVRWIAHVAAAQMVWWERVEAVPQSGPVWPELSLDESAWLLDEAGRRWAELVAALGPEGLERRVAYANSRGERFDDRLGDILTHVTHHGAYHRGQIAAAVRAAGGEPAATDFIHAVRTGRVE
jgi:uncharacterized damage-inducible protein DinB